MNRLIASASLIALTFALPVVPAMAQDAEDNARNVETIIVTAQKREESLQDVPISVAAYDEELIRDAGVRDIKDLTSIAPGLMVTSTQSETITTARIRGIGTVGDNFGLESSVGVYIDGVFRARNGVALSDLGEIAQIEVLRGPQGTLFGKNTSAGVLSVNTARPTDETFASVEATAGNFGYTRLAGTLNGELGEGMYGRAFVVRGNRDGFTDILIDDGTPTTEESETQDYWSARGQLLWDIAEDASLLIIGDWTERDELCCSAVQWDFTSAAAGLVAAVGGQVLNPADPEERQAFSNVPFEQNVQEWGISGQLDWTLGNGVDVVSITSFRDWANQRSQDIDYSSADIARREIDNNFTNIERFSQELRFQGQSGALDWLVGGFYSNEKLQLSDAIEYGADWESYLGLVLSGGASPAAVYGLLVSPPPGGFGIPASIVPTPGNLLPAGSGANQDLYNQDATSYALFTHNTYDVNDQLSLTFGLRYTSEEKELDATFETAPTPGCAVLEQVFGLDPLTGAAIAGVPAAALPAIANICLPYGRTGLDFYGYDASRTDEEFSGVAKASYRFNDDLMGYAGYSRGFKAGGFNLDRQFNGPRDANGYSNVDPSFSPEIVDAYEAGLKSEWLNNALLLNANLFYQITEDFQLNTFNGLNFVVESVDEVKSQGVEVDFLYFTPVDGLDLQGGFAYVDATYEEVNTGDPLVDAIAGKNLSLSPEYYLNGAVTYARPISDTMVARFHLDGRWVSEYNTGSDLDPEKVQDAFGLINARIGVGAADENWALELWGRNLTDETYAQVAFDAFAQGRRGGAGTSNDPRSSAGYAAFLGAPRTYGVTLRKTW
jgi:iron complex outermembrane recepter protein